MGKMVHTPAANPRPPDAAPALHRVPGPGTAVLAGVIDHAIERIGARYDADLRALREDLTHRLGAAVPRPEAPDTRTRARERPRGTQSVPTVEADPERSVPAIEPPALGHDQASALTPWPAPSLLHSGSAVQAASTDMPADESAMVTVEQQLRAEAVVQRLLAPFIAEQARLAEALGRERALREAAERERDRLKEQLAAQVQPSPPRRLWRRLRQTRAIDHDEA